MVATLFASSALGHASGFHERMSLSVSRQAVDGLLVMDVDSGEKARLMRSGADLNHDGLISKEEGVALQKKLVQLATKDLKLSISGFALTLKITDTKFSLRDDRRTSDAGLSVALMFEATVKTTITEGMSLEIEATSPDQSHVLVDVTALQGRDGGAVALEQHEVQPAEKWKVRLGALAPR